MQPKVDQYLARGMSYNNACKRTADDLTTDDLTRADFSISPSTIKDHTVNPKKLVK